MTRIQKIIDKIVARLQEIETANGYRTDAGKRTILVSVEADPKREAGGQAYDTGLVIQIDPAEPTDQSGNVTFGSGDVMAHYTQAVTVFGFRKLADRDDWFGPGQELEADIKQAVFGHPEDQLFWRQIGLKRIDIATAQARVPGYGDEYLGVEVALELTYIENLSSPWEPDE